MPQRKYRTGAYQIRNLVNGKVYVGGAYKSFWRRWAGHRDMLVNGRHSNEHLSAAWNKYGADSFVFEILEGCRPEKELIVAAEQRWIGLTRCCDRNKGYNKSPTAGSPLGFKHSDESRGNMSVATLGKSKTESHRANMSKAKRNMTDETKAKMAEAARNRSPEHRAKLGEAQKGNQHCLGRKCSEETRERLRQKTKECWERRRETGEDKEIGNLIREGRRRRKK